MKRVWCVTVLAVVLASWAAGPVRAQDDESARQLLDTIREDLVELRFEKALAGIEAFLGTSGMSAAERTEALVLRAQAHVAFGDLEGAEKDYREILALRPGYRPDPSLTPKKAMTRFEKVRGEMIGLVRVTVDPPDARVAIDGHEAVPDADGTVALLVGEHAVRAEAPGHDVLERAVVVEAGAVNAVELELTPNARTVILETIPDDVEVWLDGEPVGRTRLPRGEVRGVGVLTLENLPLGDHTFELRKDCFRTTRFEEILTVNLLDRSAYMLETVRMTPARSTILLEGGPEGGNVFVEGQEAGKLPIDPYAVCPGRREVTVRYAGRMLWSTLVDLPPSTEVVLDVEPRPNAVVFGVPEWPAALREFGRSFNTRFEERLPRGLDPEDAADWRGARLPEGTDLVVAVVPASRVGERDRWYGYSPVLRVAGALERVPEQTGAPRWTGVAWGLATADSVRLGPAVVARVAPDGAAAAAGLLPGDRVLRADGRGIESSAELRVVLATAGAAGRPVELEWERGAETFAAAVAGRPTPVVHAEPRPFDDDIVRAAWAVAQSLAAGDRAPEALANLALLFSRYDQPELAESTWRRVRWRDRAGIGAGTRAYYLGRALERLGREDDAIEQYRIAAASSATAFSDDGPAIAPAAVDRLADFGVRVEPPTAP